MRLHKANIDKVVKVNGLRVIDSAVPLERGIPTEAGLFSRDIFGSSTNERRNIPAYIDLHDKYLHPLAYNTLKTLNRKFESLIAGTMTFKIDSDGQLKEDPNGETGLRFLYENWNKLKFRERSSIFATERIKSLQNRDKNWVDKWIVIPAFFRDINFNEEGRPSYDHINEIYMNLIRMSASVAQQEQYGLVSNLTRARVQFMINEIHDTIINTQLRAKSGVFKKFTMGKNVDFGARLVISAPIIKGERYDDVQVQFNRIGLPLATVCSIFFPFVVYALREYLRNEFQLAGKYAFRNKKGELEYITLENPDYYFSDEYIIKVIKKFIYGASTRFDPIPLPANKEGKTGFIYFTGKFGQETTSISRPITWTDILFRICMELAESKHVYVTRYPIEDNFGINPSKFTVLSTKNTIPAMIGDKYYQYYPKVEPNKASDIDFIDTLHVHNSYLVGFGGDYDGDMLSVTGCFTNEANEDAERYLRDKKYLLSLTGDNMRVQQRDLVQTMFAMTKQKQPENMPKYENLSRVAKF